MAQRFGGPHSPGGETPSIFRGRQAQNFRIAARAMYLAPLPLFFAGLGEVMAGDALGMVTELGGFAALMLSAALLNEGLRAEAAYDARSVARPPAVPRKALGAVATALGVGLGAASGGAGLVGGVIFGAVAGGLQVVAFGLDPMKAKGATGVSSFESERAARALDKAEATVAEILEAAHGIGDRRLEARVERMVAQVRQVFRAVEEDPRDLSRARRFLGVYLVGARDATRKFAGLYAKRQDPQARAEYEALLDDLEGSFRRHRDDLLTDDRTDLDVEIEVLRERLQREGV